MGLLSPAEAVACQHVLRTHARSFALASRLLPERLRDPASALYAFCRDADDAVDDETARDAAMRGAERLHRRIDLVYAGMPDGLVDTAFARVVEHFGIPRALPDALAAGLDADARGTTFDSCDEVLTYAFQVAGSVGLMMNRLMGVTDPAAMLRAADLGVAMQLTNIARDLGEDARRGRCYVPASWCEAIGLDPARMAAGSVDGASREAARRLLAWAEGHYEAADAGICHLPGDCRLAITSARQLYAGIGGALAANGYDAVSRRAFVGPRRRAWLLATAAAQAMHPGASDPPGPADGLLRRHLLAVGMISEASA